MTIQQIKNQIPAVDNSDNKSMLFKTVGTVVYLPYSMDKFPWYKAPPDPNEMAKVDLDINGNYYCSKNGKTYSSYVPRYLLRLCIQDFTGKLWLTAFGNCAQKILGGIECKTLDYYIEKNDVDAYQNIFNDVVFNKYIFTIKCEYKYDHNYEQRINYRIVNVNTIDYDEQCESVMNQLLNILS